VSVWVGREAVEWRQVEFFGKNDLAVELVDRFSPGVWAERVVVDTQPVLGLFLALENGRKEGQDGLPRGCLATAARRC